MKPTIPGRFFAFSLPHRKHGILFALHDSRCQIEIDFNGRETDDANNNPRTQGAGTFALMHEVIK
jgi:hypothetical protein